MSHWLAPARDGTERQCRKNAPNAHGNNLCVHKTSGEHTCTWCFEMPVRVRRRNSDERIHGPCREYYSWCCVKMLFLEFVFTTGTWSRSRCGPSGEHTCTWCFEMPVRVRRRNSDERIHGPCREYYSWCCVKMLFLEFVSPLVRGLQSIRTCP